MGHDWDGYISILDAARINDHCRIHCSNPSCDHAGRLDFAPIINRHGPNVGLGKILRTLRCQKCGQRGAFPITLPGTKENPARPIYCPLSGRSTHRCDPLGECKDGCRLG
ncbi:hypothetical protein [Paremcibacter congregatus]|uniref:hypothetical protein n=1 Tax=Paremcibacter congregatus TaxID=2043170 RepID=UPI003A933FF8